MRLTVRPGHCKHQMLLIEPAHTELMPCTTLTGQMLSLSSITKDRDILNIVTGSSTCLL